MSTQDEDQVVKAMNYIVGGHPDYFFFSDDYRFFYKYSKPGEIKTYNLLYPSKSSEATSIGEEAQKLRKFCPAFHGLKEIKVGDTS